MKTFSFITQRLQLNWLNKFWSECYNIDEYLDITANQTDKCNLILIGSAILQKKIKQISFVLLWQRKMSLSKTVCMPFGLHQNKSLFRWCLIESRYFSTTKQQSPEKNIQRSSCQDVVVKPIPRPNLIWDESTKLYPDKIAMVNQNNWIN